MPKLKRFDTFLFIVFLAISIVSAYLSYRIYTSPRNSNSVRVGYISNAPGDVFRKGSEEFFYSRQRLHTLIYNWDQITTGTESRAEIKLDQGSTISLDQLSHILISIRNGQYSFDIKSGSTRAVLANGQALIVDGARVFSAEDGPAELLYKKFGGNSEITVLSGQVKVSDGDTTKILTPENGQTRMGPQTGDPEKIVLTYPANEQLVTSSNREVELSWNSIGENIQYKIEIINDNQIIQTFETPEDNLVVTLPAEGEYQWQVSAKNEKKMALSEKRKFQIGAEMVAAAEPVKKTSQKKLPQAPPTPLPMKVSPNGIEIPHVVEPVANQKVKSTGEITKVKVKLYSKTCTLYEVEADTDPEFSIPVIRRTRSVDTYLALKAGTYHIHARCWKDGDMGIWSPAKQFDLK